MSSITKGINLALNALKQGEIVAIPTETVYGLAANAENELAIKKVFALKNRPLNHPLIMHIANHWDLAQWVDDIPDYSRLLMQHFWPGPLTLVFKCNRHKVSPVITGGQTTVAIRSPAHPLTQQLLTKLGFPLVAPSANPFGKISPTTAQHVYTSFPQPLLILDGGRSTIGIESTIIDATSAHYQVLRHGTIDEEAIKAVIYQTGLNADNPIRVPGKLASHYQPEKPLYCFEGLEALQQFCQDKKTIYILSFSKQENFNAFAYYQLPDTPQQLAYELYYQLRQAADSLASSIAIELPPNEPAWQGIRERLLKAGQLIVTNNKS